MGKLTGYIVLMSGIMLLFYFGGVLDQTLNSTLLDMLLKPENIKMLSLSQIIILGIAAVATTATVIVGIVTGQAELAASFAVATYILSLGWDFLAVTSALYAQSGVIAILVMSPPLIAYLMTAFEFWRGRD